MMHIVIVRVHNNTYIIIRVLLPPCNWTQSQSDAKTASGDQSADLALAMGKEADRTVALCPITTHDRPVSFRVQP
jgi:hypothetical protein